MATSKKLEGAFRYLSSYDGKEYRALDGTPESFLLKIIYSSSSGGATFIGSQHIDRHRERSSRIIKGIVSSFNSYLKRTPIARRLVMVEGFSGDPTCLDTLEKSFESGEPVGVTFLARNAGIEVFSPEPTSRETVKELMAMGFGKYQMLLYFVARQTPQEMDSQRINQRVVPYAQYLAAVMSSKGDGSLRTTRFISDVIPELNRMMEKLYGKKLFRIKNHLIYSNFAREELWSATNPTLPIVAKEKSTVLNEIAYRVNEMRDRHILAEIWRVTRSGKSPFVVYGRSHVARLKPALDHLYGKPIKVEC